MIIQLHPDTPVIWDWCVPCRLYISHDHGWSIDKRVSLIRCRRCLRHTTA